MAGSAIGILVLSALPLQLSSFVLLPAPLPALDAHQRTSRVAAAAAAAAGEHGPVVGSCFVIGSERRERSCTTAHGGLLLVVSS